MGQAILSMIIKLFIDKEMKLFLQPNWLKKLIFIQMCFAGAVPKFKMNQKIGMRPYFCGIMVSFCTRKAKLAIKAVLMLKYCSSILFTISVNWKL